MHSQWILVCTLLKRVCGINHFVGMPREHPSTASRVQTLITTERYWQDFMHEVCHGDDFNNRSALCVCQAQQ